jgi:tRNA(Ile)-lysidine synthase
LVRISHPSLRLDTSLFKPGIRIAVGLSGGADSVALLCALVERSRELGLVLHAAHLHHGLRGEEADGDLEFCRALADRLGVPFHCARVDTAAEARANPATTKPAETIEEAARRLRYQWFRQLLSKTPPHAVALDAVATAHTLDDQAETVLAKFLRGAWTEGLAGISPKLESPEGLDSPNGAGHILRPLLATTRAEVESYLNLISQPWREDSSNRHLTFTRNRIRHELLPLLEKWNPQLRTHLANMATLARDEEAWWATELDCLAPQFILHGRPVRGGGRAASGEVALDCTRLAVLATALQRRLLRHAAQSLGAEPDFNATEALLDLTLHGHAGQRLQLAQSLTAERTPRELRFSLGSGPRSKSAQAPQAQSKRASAPPSEYQIPIPGRTDAPAFGIALQIALTTTPSPLAPNSQSFSPLVPQSLVPSTSFPASATLRNWRPGDRVWLRHSSGPRRVKEVLGHLRVTGSERAIWPVLELDGRLIWMQGVELEPEPRLTVIALPISEPEEP